MQSVQKFIGRIASILFALAGGLLLFYSVSGQSVGEDGVLLEQFWALALGVGLLALSAMAGLVYLVLMLAERYRNNKRNP